MTPDQFNTALSRCIAIEAAQDGRLPCYPIIGIDGNADAFHAYDNERQVLLRGIFSEVIDQNALDRAIAVANASPLNDADDGISVVPCIIAPYDAPLTATSEDVLLYYVATNSDGMLAGTLEFTDYEVVCWDEWFDEDEDDWDDEGDDL